MKAESSSMASTRITRSRKKAKPAMEEGASGMGPIIPLATKEEKGKRKSAVNRRKAGRLAGLVALPLDILFEIFGHLHPYDLLKLARMTKDFRRVLMGHSSISVWKAALANVDGLPACPSSMTEPEWVNLVFSPHCHFCLTSSVRTVEWGFRIRICSGCSKDRLRRCTYHAIDYDDEDEVDKKIRPNFEQLVPTKEGKRHSDLYLIDDYEAVKSQYYSLEGEEARVEFMSKRVEVVEEIMDHAALCEGWALMQAENRSEELQAQRDQRRDAIKKRLEDLGFGDELMGITCPDVFEDHRLVKQTHPLTDRVWSNIKGPMLQYMQEMKDKRLVRERVALVFRRKKIAIEVLRAYKNSRLPCTEVMPGPPDFCKFPVIKAILEQPSEVTVDASSFSDIVSCLPQLFSTWRDSIDKKLAGVVQTQYATRRRISILSRRYAISEDIIYDSGEDEDEADPSLPAYLDEEEASRTMQLASTVYVCRDCMGWHGIFITPSGIRSSIPLFYPQVLGHSCLMLEDSAFSMMPGPHNSDPATSFSNRYIVERRPWRCDCISVDRYLSEIAKVVVEVAGLDPKTATTEEMDALPLQFACMNCSMSLADHEPGHEDEPIPPRFINKNTQLVPIFDWRELIMHHGTSHSVASPLRASKLSAEDVEQSRIDRMGHPFDRNAVDEDALRVWCCAHCRDLPSESNPLRFDSLKGHILQKHDISEPELNVDYFKDYAAPEKYPSAETPVMITLVFMETGAR